MDIKITHQSLKQFVETNETAEGIATKVSLCGPTFDRFHSIDDDVIFEIEAITNRIDTASVFGVARETVAVLNQFDVTAKLINDPYQKGNQNYSQLPETFKISFDDPDLVKRFIAVSLHNVEIKNSPDEVIKFLNHCDQRPINNLVDITNELTLLYGMPSHIFDLDKISGKTLNLRESHKGESVTTLNGVNNKLQGKDIIIEDGSQQIIDLCGVMGGSLAEVGEHTNNLLLIVPVYEPKHIRKTSLYLQNRTLASQIYEKSPDPEICLSVANLAIELFQQRANATVGSPIFDFYPKPYPPKLIALDLNWLNNFIGYEIEPSRIISILSDLGFGGQHEGDQLICSVPSFRYLDINLPEDLAEEIARIYGYFRLPSQIPNVQLASSEPNRLLSSEYKAKNYLSHLGFHEVYNNSLISQKQILDCQLKVEDHLKLTNALSAEFEYLRISLLPSLLINYKNNQHQTESTLNLFELSNVYQKQNKGHLPDEISTLSFVSDQDFRSAKGYLESLLGQLNIKDVIFRAENKSPVLFTPNATASIVINGQKIGHLGLLSPQVSQTLSLKKEIIICELNFLSLSTFIGNPYEYQPISQYPDMVEDITLANERPVGELMQKIRSTNNLITEVIYLSSFQNKHSFKVIFNSQEGNLTQDKINQIKEEILKQLS